MEYYSCIRTHSLNNERLEKCRLRLGSAPQDTMPLSDEPFGAIDSQIRRGTYKSVIRPELGLSFDSLGEAYDTTSTICTRGKLALVLDMARAG